MEEHIVDIARLHEFMDKLTNYYNDREEWINSFSGLDGRSTIGKDNRVIWRTSKDIKDIKEKSERQ